VVRFGHHTKVREVALGWLNEARLSGGGAAIIGLNHDKNLDLMRFLEGAGFVSSTDGVFISHERVQ
jgi:hypothetical protein